MIRKLKIDIPNRNIDEYAIRDNAYLMHDCYFNENLGIKKRPGTTIFKDLREIDAIKYNSKIDGLYWWSEEKSVIAVCGQDIIKITDKAGSYSIIGNDSLPKGERCTFTKVADSANSNATTLFIANGSQVAYTTGGAAINFPAGVTGSAPSRVTHVSSLDGYLILNDLDNPTLIKHSNATTPLNFSAGLDFSAQAKTDDINGQFQNANFIWVQGQESMEPFYDTGRAVPFLRVNGGLVETGTVNPHAANKIDNNIFFLNTQRQIILLSGTVPKNVSLSYAKRIQQLVSINDVETDIIAGLGGKTFVLFNFKDAGTTIVYDYSLKLATGLDIFYEWGTWDKSKSQYTKFKYTFPIYCPDWNVHLVGDVETGVIYTLSDNEVTDNGESIRTEIVTGIYGNPISKTAVNALYMDFRRGDGQAADKYSAPKAYLQHRDNFDTSWSNQIEFNLGSIGRTERDELLGIVGGYYTRQYRILHMDKSNFVFNGIWEDINVN